MATSPSSSAAQARQAIADRLRELLRDASLTSRALAQAAGWEESKCSRLLHGRTPPSDEDIRLWCTICGVPDEIPNLIAASRNAESAFLEWRRVKRSQKRMQELTNALHEESTLYRFYSSNLIPWPLQTPDYMRAMMTRFSVFHRAPVPDIEDAVKARVARKRYLRKGERTCAIIIEETVLRNRIFDQDVLRGQLEHLLIGMRQANISLGILPMDRARRQKPAETFHLYDAKTVSIETISAIITITQPSEVDLYVRCFTELADDAVYGNEARALISRALEALA